MKQLICLLAVVFVCNLTAKSQSTWPPVYEIKADTAVKQIVDDKYWQLLEDPSAKLTIGQVSSAAYDGKFHINNTRTKGYDYHVTNYWLRYKFKNILSYPVKLAIPERVAYAYLYIKDTIGKWHVQTTGTLVPWSKRDGIKRLRYFVIKIKPGQEVAFYEKDIFDFTFYKPKIFEFTISYADAAVEKWYVNNDRFYYAAIIYSLILGILLLACFINILFYRIVREKVYLYFAIFIMFFGLYDFFAYLDNIFFREYLYVYMYLPLLLFIGTSTFTMHFLRHFLSTHIYTPKWDKILIILNILQLLSFAMFLFLPPTINYNLYQALGLFGNGVIFLYMLCLLATLIIYLIKNYGSGRVGIFAALPGFLFWSAGYLFLYISERLNALYNIPYSKLYNWMVALVDETELVCFLWMILVFSWILFKRYQLMQQSLVQTTLDKERLAKEQEIERSQLIEKQNELLEQQVEARTAELKRSVEELKNTQQQLIQSEKLASLGELTAGIAHEIQNPLNFVNNFSEVSMELTVEMKDELKAGNATEAATIADDIEQNLQKIIHHGKRADAIVKNMLQHSRNNSAEKQLTDINALADEYLRLSYHGLRAKDKSFNADMVTNFDHSLPRVNIVPQDIGRVLLNLFNNAFYAVNQKKKTAGDNYKPTITITTFAPPSGGWGASVADNGDGIPYAVKAKILQPFFTTKPTGEGTGLGLSLSYDIVVKGHGGTLNINSKEGEGAEFMITIPLNN